MMLVFALKFGMETFQSHKSHKHLAVPNYKLNFAHIKILRE